MVDFPRGTTWGVCLSHDVDHLSLREHFIDPFLVRYLLNLARQDLLFRFRPVKAVDACWGLVLAAFGHDRWDVTGELLEMERRKGVRSTWFVPVQPGLGIAYGPDRAATLARWLVEAGQDVGLHGQSAQKPLELAAEAHLLSSWTGSTITGLRMHYLRLTDQVLDGMRHAQLKYDSTVMDRTSVKPEEHPLPEPRMLPGGLVEIPLHIMDSTLFSATGLGLNLEQAKTYTTRLLGHARQRGIVVVVNTHPNLCSAQSPDIRDWYQWLLDEITGRSDAFVTDFRGLASHLQPAMCAAAVGLPG